MVGGTVMFVKGTIFDANNRPIPVCEIARQNTNIIIDFPLWKKIQKHWPDGCIDGDYVFDERIANSKINYADWEEIGIMMGWLPDWHSDAVEKIGGDANGF